MEFDQHIFVDWVSPFAYLLEINPKKINTVENQKLQNDCGEIHNRQKPSTISLNYTILNSLQIMLQSSHLFKATRTQTKWRKPKKTMVFFVQDWAIDLW